MVQNICFLHLYGELLLSLKREVIIFSWHISSVPIILVIVHVVQSLIYLRLFFNLFRHIKGFVKIVSPISVTMLYCEVL